jgi:hypothetical protein
VDSPLEESGFEPLVPLNDGDAFQNTHSASPGCPIDEQFGWPNLPKRICGVADSKDTLNDSAENADYAEFTSDAHAWRICFHSNVSLVKS